jgi:hypothetical protein
MDPEISDYYPPRASDRWMSRWTGNRMERWRLGLLRAFRNSPLGRTSVASLSGAQFLWVLAVPGRGYGALGHPLLARLFLTGWAVCLGVAVVFLPVSAILGWAVGGMASAHSSGPAFVLLRQIESNLGAPPPWRHRLMLPLALWAVYAAAVYWPLHGWVGRHWAHPLEVVGTGQTLVFRPEKDPSRLSRGETVAFHQEGFRLSGRGGLPVLVGAGPIFGRLIGFPGDVLEFQTNGVRVAGRLFSNLPGMPTSGRIDVEKGQWIVWPSVDLRVMNNGGLDESTVSDAFLEISRVDRGEFLGPAYGWWFFWRQDLP